MPVEQVAERGRRERSLGVALCAAVQDEAAAEVQWSCTLVPAMIVSLQGMAWADRTTSRLDR